MIKNIREQITKDFLQKINYDREKSIAVNTVGRFIKNNNIWNYYLVYKHITTGLKVKGFDCEEDVKEAIAELENNVCWIQLIELKEDIGFIEDVAYYTGEINDFLAGSTDSEGYQLDVVNILKYLIKNESKNITLKKIL